MTKKTYFLSTPFRPTDEIFAQMGDHFLKLLMLQETTCTIQYDVLAMTAWKKDEQWVNSDKNFFINNWANEIAETVTQLIKDWITFLETFCAKEEVSDKVKEEIFNDFYATIIKTNQAQEDEND